MRLLTLATVRRMVPRHGRVLMRMVVAVTAIGLAEPLARDGAAAAVSSRTNAVIVRGTLVHHRLTNDLFHIDGLWMRVAPGTVFHRWLLGGSGHKAAIAMTDDPSRFADLPDVRILTGRLIHQTAPSASPVIHVVFLVDSRSGSVGAVTFQTTDRRLAALFDEWSDSETSVVIDIH